MAETKQQNNFLAPFIPGPILKWYQENQTGKIHRISKYSGILVFIDIAGFTALTKRLSEDPRQGPELLTIIMNKLFRRIDKTVRQFNGHILKYAGDAVWIYLNNGIDLHKFFNLIFASLDETNKTSLGHLPEPIDLHIGAESGEFALVSLGSPETRIEVELFGEIVSEVMQAADQAQKGEIVIGPILAYKIKATENLEFLKDSYFKLKTGRSILETEDTSNKKANEILYGDIDILKSYIPADILNRFEENPGSDKIANEFRHVIVLFAKLKINTQELSSIPAEYQELNDEIKKLFDIIRHHNGMIARIDPYVSSHKLLVLFGAPFSHENDTINAAACALKLTAINSRLINISIGMSGGKLFCGGVGSETRREYAVMGESINLAARLMGVAQPREILIDNNLRQNLPENIITDKTEYRLKGFNQPYHCYLLKSIKDFYYSRNIEFKPVGQEKYIEKLRVISNVIDKSFKKQIQIYGESGVGKTTLINSFLDQHISRKSIFLTCRYARLYDTGWPFKKFLSGILDIAEKTETIKIEISRLIGKQWWPLFADIFGVQTEESEWTRGMSPELRLEKTKRLILKILKDKISSETSLIIDDFELADDFFKEVLSIIDKLPQSIPLLLLISSRKESISPSDKMSFDEKLHIKPPADEEWQKFYHNLFVDRKRNREFFDRLLKNSARNPQYIVEFIKSSIDNGQLIADKNTGKFDLAETSIDLIIPESARDIYLHAFDRLPERSRDILKALSVSMSGATLKDICRVLQESKDELIKSNLIELSNSGILKNTGEYFEFSTPLMQDIVYDCIPSLTLKSYHSRYGSLLESKHKDTNAHLLAVHYYRSGKWDKAFKYSLTAAKNSFKIYSINDTSRMFHQCREILKNAKHEELDESLLYDYFRSCTTFLIHDGKFDKTYPLFSDWRKTSRNFNNAQECFQAVSETARVLWKQSRYGRSRFFLEKILKPELLNKYEHINAYAMTIRAELARRTGDFLKAEESCLKAIKIASANNDNQVLADAYNNLGLALWGQGKLDEALNQYEKSLKYGEIVGGMYARAQTANNMAIIYWEKGDLVHAAQLMEKSITIFSDIGDIRNEAYAAANLATLQRTLGRFESSRKSMLQADHVFDQLHDRHAHHYIIGNLGDLDLVEGDLNEASKRFNTTYNFAKEVGDKELSAECSVRLAEIAFYSGDISNAEMKFVAAIDEAQEINSTEYTLRAKTGLARLLIGQKKSAGADKILNQIATAATESNNLPVLNEAFFLQGELYRIEGKIERAVEKYREILEYAADQSVFELRLKCIVRLIEFGNESEKYKMLLKDLHNEFIQVNNKGLWKKIMESAYYRFFVDTIKNSL